MSVAAILEQHGFVPVAPVLSRKVGTPQTIAVQRVPVVPAVPVQKHKGGNSSNLIRQRMLEIAQRNGIDQRHIDALSDTEMHVTAKAAHAVLMVSGAVGLHDMLNAYARALDNTSERMAGRVPADETMIIICGGCGPVWASPDVAAVLPVVNGAPRALGCPWCHVRKAGRYVPRPRVHCATCTHYVPDDVNPAGGAGHCGPKPTDIHRMHYPKQQHRCADYTPKKPELA